MFARLCGVVLCMPKSLKHELPHMQEVSKMKGVEIEELQDQIYNLKVR